MAQWLSDLDPGNDCHLEVKLVEKHSLDGLVWKAHALGMGVVHITFERCFSKHLTCEDTLWIWNYITVAKGEIVASSSMGAKLIKRPIVEQPISQGKLAELFGGITGWSTAASMMGQMVSFVIEKCPQVAKVAADMYGCPCKDFEDVWGHFVSTGEFSEPCIWVGNVTDFRMWTLMSLISWGTSSHGKPTVSTLVFNGEPARFGIGGWAIDGSFISQSTRLGRSFDLC